MMNEETKAAEAQALPDDQPEEERPGLDRMVSEHVFHQLGEREHAHDHSDEQPKKECPMNILPELLDLSFDQQFP